MHRSGLLLVAVAALMALNARSGAADAPRSPYEVVWDSPSEDSGGTMPLGNGEVALNAWIEPSGDLRFYIARTDSWDDNGRLVKVGSVRVRVGLVAQPPSAVLGRSAQPRAAVPLTKTFCIGDASLQRTKTFCIGDASLQRTKTFCIGDASVQRTKTFRQALTVRDGTMAVRYGEGEEQVDLRLWVDARRPLVCVEIHTKKPTQSTAFVELWRTKQETLPSVEVSDIFAGRPGKTVVEPDTVLAGLADRVGWYHRNIKSIGPELCAKVQGVADFPRPDPLLHRTFGALIATERPERLDDRAIRSKTGTSHVFEVYVHTKHPATAAEWLAEAQRGLDEARTEPLANRRAEHEKWWADFWGRSWIHITGNDATSLITDGDDAFIVSRAYALQRYVSACAGRGRYPIKFNGSLFTVPAEGQPGNADYRRWGPGYWWQNTRLPYYSMCASGDFELMEPLVRMYARDLMPLFQFRTRRYLDHDGAYIPECIYFWGDVFTETYGWQPANERKDKLQASGWHKWEWVSGLELVGLLLDYYEHTGDARFLRDTALPAAREILAFFDQHYKTGPNGKLFMHPAQALETWWDCVNPMPELAGLHAATARLLALPETTTTADERAFWRQLRAKLPDLPTLRTDDGKVMLAAAKSFKDKRNIENPELYAVFPFRLVAFDKPLVRLGIEALNQRKDKGALGWRQDDVFMAYLGLADQAREYVVKRARSKHAGSRFPAFWGPNYDWVPDQDHGSVLLKAVQAMLMQTDGRQIHLLPAWPKDWNADFKLHAPWNTTVSGKVEKGKLVQLSVEPESRRKDVKVPAER